MTERRPRTNRPSAAPGFNPDQSWGVPPKRGARPAKPNDGQGRRRLPPADVEDFFIYGEAVDHIIPRYEDKKKGKGKGNEDAGETNNEVDIDALLASLGRKKQDDDDDNEDDPRALRDLPDYGAKHSSSEDDDSEDRSDGDDRGIYHHEVVRVEEEAADVRSSQSHPVSIKGEPNVGCLLEAEDQSPWVHQFPVIRVEWFLAEEIGTQTHFGVYPDSTTAEFKIPAHAVGKFIQLRCSRRIYDQMGDTNIEGLEAGVFDAHVGKPKHTKLGIEKDYYTVQSNAIVGPILISDQMAYVIGKALSTGTMGAAIKLRDEPMDDQGEAREDGARNRLSKLPGYLQMSFEHVEVLYEQPAAPAVANSPFFSKNWLANIFRFNRDEKTADSAKRTDDSDRSGPVRAQWQLTSIQLRPSKRKATLILAAGPVKVGFSHRRVTQNLLRFDVDPNVGRDTLLFAFIAFQAAVENDGGTPDKWKQAVENGDYEKCKLLIQRHLHALTTFASETAPAFEEMPHTPWSY